MNRQAKIIDGDGHVFEDAEGIARHFPYTVEGARLRSGVFPSQSHIQFSLTRRPPGAFGIRPDGRFQNPGPEGWIEFMDEIGLEYAVLFPTTGQRVGRLVDQAPLELTTTGSLNLTSGGIAALRALVFCRCMTPKRRWKSYGGHIQS